MAVQVRKVTCEDWEVLQKLSVETYTETFGAFNSEANMAIYLETAYHQKKLLKELSNRDSLFLFIYVSEELAGYLKTNVNEAQTEPMAMTSLEIERVYIKKKFKRQGLGKLLITEGIKQARKLEKEAVWLGVWEHNQPAMAFYQSLGFVQTGAHSFFMGDDEQTDLIVTKQLKKTTKRGV